MKKKLLIAEDEKLNQMLLDKILGEEFDLLAYLDGQQAMDALQELAESIDLVLLDLNMPKKNGFEFLAEMRESAKLKRIPVIVITGMRFRLALSLISARNSNERKGRGYWEKRKNFYQKRRLFRA